LCEAASGGASSYNMPVSDSGDVIVQGRDNASHDVTAYEQPQYCRYCGAPLNPMFYFCLRCATPFKSVNSVIPPHRPRKLTAEELVEIKAPRVWTIFWTYMGVLIGVFFLGEMLFVEDRPDLKILLGDAAIFVTTCVFATMYWRSLVTQFKRLGFGHPVALLGLLALVPLLAFNYVYSEMFIPWAIDDPEMEDWLQNLRDSGMSEAALIFSVCIIPAVTEEIAFRGLVQHWLQVAIKPWHALVLASALFAALHFSMLSFPYLFAVGLLLGWTKLRTGSLYPAIWLHFLHNLAVIQLFPLISS